MEQEVRAAFENRPRKVESYPAFLGLEVLQDGPAFVLLTRWTDEESFREWHRSSHLHESHALIPSGLKLDPNETMLVVGETIDAATSFAPAGSLVLETFLPIAQLVNDGHSVHVAIVDEDGGVTHANRAFQRSFGADLVGRRWDSVLDPSSRQLFWARLDEAHDDPFLVQMTSASSQPFSLSIHARRTVDGVTVVGEPPWGDHVSMTDQLLGNNAELSVLVRENARQARLLAEANRKLKEAYWHLDKIAEVLPMCLSCREVKTGDGEWEDVASFLMKHSDFLSHGYCDACAENILGDADEES
jgi:heme-degrading monooxygenase HmoA